ncbi:MAG: hypothetical protein D6694_03650 [Gammaproteobacteria bacterium]|nr:MAG: hypothetical protein D6694_03650 [Gammaproteobacteria bacterium]
MAGVLRPAIGGDRVDLLQGAYLKNVEAYETPVVEKRIQDAPEESGLRDPVLLRKEQEGEQQQKTTGNKPGEAPKLESEAPAVSKARRGGSIGKNAGVEIAGEEQPVAGGASAAVGGRLGTGSGGAAGGRPGHGGVRSGTANVTKEGRCVGSDVVGVEGRLSDRVRARMERLPDAVRTRFETARRAIASDGGFDLYVPRSPIAPEDFHTHPTPLVECKSLAGIDAPELEAAYRPHEAVMGALRRGAISVEANLDAIWAAVQQNDKHNMGVLIADDVSVGKTRKHKKSPQESCDRFPGAFAYATSFFAVSTPKTHSCATPFRGLASYKRDCATNLTS